MNKGIIFDLDGVLINSEEIWKQMMTDFCAQFHVEYTPEIRAKSMGTNAEEWSMVLRDACHLDHTTWPLERVQQEVLAPMEWWYDERLQLMPGAMELLQHIRNAEIPCALASGSSARNIVSVFNRFNLYPYFDAVFSGNHVTHNKPHPEIYLRAAEALRIDPRNCVGIEDSPNGIRAVSAAGMKSIAMPDPWMKDHDAFRVAHLTITRLEELSLDTLLS